MKRKYTILIVAFLMICTCTIPVSGASGTIRLPLPAEMKGQEIFYQVDGEEKSVQVQDDGMTVIENLSPGDYKLHIPDSKEYEFSDVEVRVPTWSEEEERMLYDITIEPKYQRVEETPKTGDDAPVILYGAAGLLAFASGIGCMVTYHKKRKVK